MWLKGGRLSSVCGLRVWCQRPLCCPSRFQTPEADFWIIPIIQGFVQIEELVVNYNDTSDEEKSSPETPPQEATCVDEVHPRFLVALISRRSRHRAGEREARGGPRGRSAFAVMVGSGVLHGMLCRTRGRSEVVGQVRKDSGSAWRSEEGP